MGAHLKEKLDPARFDALMVAAGFKSDYALAKALGVQPDQPGRWRRGLTSPSGAVVAKLAATLTTTAGYLFGRSDDDEREALLALVEKMMGRTVRSLVDYTGSLKPHHRALLASQIQAWVQGYEASEKLDQPKPVAVEEEPLFPFDADRGRARAPVSASHATDEEPATEPQHDQP